MTAAAVTGGNGVGDGRWAVTTHMGRKTYEVDNVFGINTLTQRDTYFYDHRTTSASEQPKALRGEHQLANDVFDNFCDEDDVVGARSLVEPDNAARETFVCMRMHAHLWMCVWSVEHNLSSTVSACRSLRTDETHLH